MDQKQDRERERDSDPPDREASRETPVRRDENEAVPEFERGSDLDRGQDERQSER